MTRRNVVLSLSAVGILVFAVVAVLISRTDSGDTAAILQRETLERPYSPHFGAQDAPVTLVEFFDPACETCRSFHPVVKEILDDFKGDVRVVMRYAALHKGSDEAVRILESARLQGLYEPVLEALYEAQPKWAAHGSPDLEEAWKAAGAAGLDISRARKDMLGPEVTKVLRQDNEDVQAMGVKKTPTFFVNGKPLSSFGKQQLYDLVKQNVLEAYSR